MIFCILENSLRRVLFGVCTFQTKAHVKICAKRRWAEKRKKKINKIFTADIGDNTRKYQKQKKAFVYRMGIQYNSKRV